MDPVLLFLDLSSISLGIIYLLAWSISFYPQPTANYKRKSVSGGAIDFPLANLLGFACYTVYTACFLFSPQIKREYAERHPNSPISTVAIWDFAFAVHAFILIGIFLCQYWWYRNNDTEDTKGRKPSRAILGICLAALCIIVVVVLLALAHETGYSAPGKIQWIDVLYTLSKLKLALTIVKYIPQVVLNYQRQSTSGWSIYTILTDFTGSVTSIAQLFVDSYLQKSDSWTEGITGNLVKLLLGSYSIIFDLIFMWQHYILYGHSRESLGSTRSITSRDDDSRPLLGEPNRPPSD